MIGRVIDPFPLQIEEFMPCTLPKSPNRFGSGGDDFAIVAEGAGQAVAEIPQQQKVQVGVGIGAMKDGKRLDHGKRVRRIKQRRGADHQRALSVFQPVYLHAGNPSRLGPALIKPEEKMPSRQPEGQGKRQPQPAGQPEKTRQCQQKGEIKRG